MIENWIDWLPDLLSGLKTSMVVAALSLLFGMPGGLLLALGMVAKAKPLRIFTIVVVEIGRGIPLLVLLYLLYFGLPTTGLVLESAAAAVLGIDVSAPASSTCRADTSRPLRASA
jgi:polar amino acid transport system permease protein